MSSEWCLWKPKGELFPTPQAWESQGWVKTALKAGQGMAFVPLYEKENAQSESTPRRQLNQLTPPAIESIIAWGNCDYLLTYELHVPRVGGPLQSSLDLILSGQKGVGSWYIGGDFPRRYYEETDGQMRRVQWLSDFVLTADEHFSWDDSGHRNDILDSGPAVKCMWKEWWVFAERRHGNTL